MKHRLTLWTQNAWQNGWSNDICKQHFRKNPECKVLFSSLNFREIFFWKIELTHQIGVNQQIGASGCLGNAHVHDVLTWNRFEFTVCLITTYTQSKHIRAQYDIKWDTTKSQPNNWKTHNALNINTKINFVLEHNISSTNKTHRDAPWMRICWDYSVFSGFFWVHDVVLWNYLVYHVLDNQVDST